MSFKEQLAKHENILNRFKALYINNENKDKQTNNETLSNIKTNIYDVLTREIPVTNISNTNGLGNQVNIPINNVRNVYCTQCGQLVYGKFCSFCGARTVIE